MEVKTLISLIVLALTASFAGATQQVRFSTQDELKKHLENVPCENDKRRDAVVALFREVGASESEVVVETFGDVQNVVVRKPGTGQGVIVIGAHYDKVKEGCGAIDNWSGIVALVNSYRAFRQVATAKTLIFVAFGREEEGLLGSKAMVKAMSEADRKLVYAMLNFDSVGLGRPQVATNISASKLTRRVRDTAESLKVPFYAGPISGDSDSTPFKLAGIQAVTVHGLSTGYEKVIHAEADQASKINVYSVYLSYGIVVTLLKDLSDDVETRLR